LRKSLIAAGVAAAFLTTGVASALAPTSTVTVSLSPSKAGTKKKPKATKLVLKVSNSQTQQTASQLKIVAPKQVTMSAKGFKFCNETKLANGTGKDCPKGSQVGPTGNAHAIAGLNGTNPTPVTFNVTPYALSKSKIGFYLELFGGAIRGLAVGTISNSGHTLTVKIPETPAQQYPKGTYNGLVDLTTNLWVKSGKGVVHTTGCPSSKKLKFTNTITFVSNSTPPGPAPAPSTASGNAGCK
jgi:hypothetical protein